MDSRAVYVSVVSAISKGWIGMDRCREPVRQCMTSESHQYNAVCSKREQKAERVSWPARPTGPTWPAGQFRWLYLQGVKGMSLPFPFPLPFPLLYSPSEGLLYKRDSR